MLKLTQSVVPKGWRDDGHTGDGTPGDCFRTAVACLLDIEDINSVPHFAQHISWWDYYRRWVRAGDHPWGPGWDVGCFIPEWPFYLEPDRSPGFVLLSGSSPRGPFRHTVVGDARTGTVVWDPHPSRAGLLRVDEVDALVAPYDPPPAAPRELTRA